MNDVIDDWEQDGTIREGYTGFAWFVEGKPPVISIAKVSANEFCADGKRRVLSGKFVKLIGQRVQVCFRMP